MPELRKMSNYPGGFRTGVSVRGLPLLNTYGGQVFWVDSGGPGGDSGNGTYHRPFKTIDYAIGRCTASNGDVIICKAGHAETLTAASAITCDVAGVTIMAAPGAVGALRPALTFSSTDNTASVVVSADEVSIIGLLGICGDDGLTAAFVVTGDDSYIDMEWQDASATVEAACAIQYNTANNVRCILKYSGFIAGNAVLNAIQLIDCDNVEIDIDAYGEFSTGIVEMLTTASTNVLVRGYFYNDNVALTKNVVNTGGLACTWWAYGYDGKGGYSFSGGSAAALAADDISTAISNQAVPTADTSTNALERDVVGNKTDAAVNAVGTTKSLMAYLKGLLNEVTVAAANTSANGFINDVVGNKTDTAQNAVNTSRSAMMYLKGIVNEITVAVANTSANGFVNDVVGNKADTAQTAVNTSRSLVAYMKGLVNNQAVPTANTSTNAFLRDVIGNKSDIATTGAVGSSQSLVAYAKQLVTETRVPTANTSTNSYIGHVIGNKSDTAVGAVTTSASMIAYVKGLVNENAVPTANTSDNAHVRDVVGNKSDTAKTGAVTTSASAMAYLKQLVNVSDGLAVANPRYFAVTALFTSATWATTANTHEVVTVTGLNRIRMLARCSGSVGGNVALLTSLGTSASTTAFIGATTATMIDTGEIWISSTTNSNVAYINYANVLDHIVNGQDVGYRLWNHASGATAGSIIFHVWWEPLSTGATCAAGAGGTLA